MITVRIAPSALARAPREQCRTEGGAGQQGEEVVAPVLPSETSPTVSVRSTAAVAAVGRVLGPLSRMCTTKPPMTNSRPVPRRPGRGGRPGRSGAWVVVGEDAAGVGAEAVHGVPEGVQADAGRERPPDMAEHGHGGARRGRAGEPDSTAAGQPAGPATTPT